MGGDGERTVGGDGERRVGGDVERRVGVMERKWPGGDWRDEWG